MVVRGPLRSGPDLHLPSLNPYPGQIKPRGRRDPLDRRLSDQVWFRENLEDEVVHRLAVGGFSATLRTCEPS